MRGAVSLALALALPRDGGLFPGRGLIVYLTFCVILFTLVGQGLTLAPLMRGLGIAGDGRDHREELEARQATARAGLARVEQLLDEPWAPPREAGEHLVGHYEDRLRTITASRTWTARGRASTRRSTPPPRADSSGSGSRASTRSGASSSGCGTRARSTTTCSTGSSGTSTWRSSGPDDAWGRAPPYHTFTRASGARKSACPGWTSNAAYHGSRLRTARARYRAGA